QQKEITRLREQNKTFTEGALQLNRIVDAIMVEVAKKFGNEVGAGIYEVIIPLPVIAEMPTELVSISRDERAATYTIRIEPAPLIPADK
ncbi:MAG: hypothetical protein IJ299_04555, partial [Oscillospiraceae bacterium]|nr:hypothetical protein [Oscillospiraceae bacterium]